MIDCLTDVFRAVCDDFAARLAECNGTTTTCTWDRVLAISQLVKSLKGLPQPGAPDELQRPNAPQLAMEPSYFAASCAGAPLSLIKRYVDNQGRPRPD